MDGAPGYDSSGKKGNLLYKPQGSSIRSSSMEIIPLSLPGLKLIRLRAFDDDRGFFKECYRKPRYDDLGIRDDFPQDNISFSKKDVLRGMHFQSDPGQSKLVSVVSGRIYDVAVDIRPDSPYFGKWEGVFLEGGVHEQLYIPVGFAHGFCVVSDAGAFVHYKVSAPYDEVTERTFRFDDPAVAIQWPTSSPLVSSRDQGAPSLKESLP
jgi:dTDP-4-dehydrorhamnose 3,5-epimerase